MLMSFVLSCSLNGCSCSGGIKQTIACIFNAGRRSLLVHYPAAADDTFCLTSTAPASTASPCHQSAEQANARDPLGSPNTVWQVSQTL